LGGSGRPSGWRISYIPYPTSEPKEALRILKGTGYDGVEWVRYLHYFGVDDLKAISVLTKDQDMEVSNLMIGHDFVVLDEAQRAERVKMASDGIQDASDAGFKLVNMTTGPGEWQGALKLGRDVPEGKAWDVVTDSFTPVLETAEKSGVTITLEAAFNMVVRDYHTMTEFLHEFDSKNLAVNMDPSHLALVGNDPAWAVRKLGGKIRHVHVKDVFGRPGTNNETFHFPLLGSGVIDWKEFFSALKSIDYSGYLTIEFEADQYTKNVLGGDWSKAAATSMEQLKALISLAGSS
jgi:sugar phosphate isomerase/epimerase